MKGDNIKEVLILPTSKNEEYQFYSDKDSNNSTSIFELNTNNSTEPTSTSTNPNINSNTSYWENELNLNLEELKQIISINNETIIKSIDSIRIKNLRVFITGCTGFTGAHVLLQLLRIINCDTIYCLVRNVKSTMMANQKINNSLKKYGLYNQINDREFQKIIPVIGDLEKPQFGLSKYEYHHLSKSVHLIINLASNNNLIESYDQLKKTNINGLKEIFKLSKNIQLKRIVNFSISFLSFNNQSLPSFSNNFENGYLNSKSISEYLISQFSNYNNSTPSMLIRLPFTISTLYNDNNNNLFYSIISNSIKSGFYPNNINFTTNLLPINYLSELIINTIFNDNNWLSNNDNKYNLVGDPITLNELFNIIISNKEYSNLSSIPYEDWENKLIEFTNDGASISASSCNITSYLDFIKFNPNNYLNNSNSNNTSNNNYKIIIDFIKKFKF